MSLVTGTPVAPRLAMTGEMSLGGEVLPVGGVREKVIAARTMGVRSVIVPKANESDIDEIPEEVRRNMTFIFAEFYDDVLEVAFPKGFKGVVTSKTKKKAVATKSGAAKKPSSSSSLKRKTGVKRKAGSPARQPRKRVAKDSSTGRKR